MRNARGLIVSNCQTQPLMHGLSLHTRGISWDVLPVHLLPAEGREAAISAALAQGPYEVTLCIPLSEDFGRLAVNRVRETFSSVVMIANLYFSGLHPDLVALDFPGPLTGRFHSRIALVGWLTGLSVDQTLHLYGDKTYKRAGYYDEFALSLDELRQRESDCDIRSADLIPPLIGACQPFYSPNHPSSELVGAYCERIAARLSARGLCQQTGWPAGFGLPDHLRESLIFPVYPEIAAQHASPAGSLCFKLPNPNNAPSQVLSLADFVAAEFSIFDAHEPTVPEQPKGN